MWGKEYSLTARTEIMLADGWRALGQWPERMAATDP